MRPNRPASRSTWTSAAGIGSVQFAVVSCENRVPSARHRSARSTRWRIDGSSTDDPACSGWPVGRVPLPLYVVMTGASRASASARTASAARRAPPPAHTIGACAWSSISRTRATAAGSGPGSATRATGRAPSGAAAAITSVAISIVAGPGSSAMWANASATAAASASGVVGRAWNRDTAANACDWPRLSCR